MKYQSSQSKRIYDIDFDQSKKARYKCPECADGRKNSKAKDLEYYPDTTRAYCFHCSTTLYEYKPFESVQVYTVPEWKNKTDLTDKSVKYFEGRMISQNTLSYINVCNPFTGYKMSGGGREHAQFGFDEVTQIKVIAREK